MVIFRLFLWLENAANSVCKITQIGRDKTLQQYAYVKRRSASTRVGRVFVNPKHLWLNV